MTIDHDKLEAIESQAFQSWFDAASALGTGGIRWQRTDIGDAACFLALDEPSILVNRVLGLGSRALPTVDRLVEIRELYADAGIGRFFLHVLPDRLGPDRDRVLTEAGYSRYRGWMKFVREAGDVSPVRTDLSVRQIDVGHATDFASIVGNAFDIGDAFQPALASLAGAEGWQVFMSFDGDTPAGTGALFTRDGIGYLDFGATHPDFRRRGGQSAVLRTRLLAARDAGCHAVVTMTGEAVAGEEQHSYRNIERAGFSPTYLRENWIPSGR